MSDYIKRLEDATDCAGAAREDDELAVVAIGDLRRILSDVGRMREALEGAAQLLEDIGWRKSAVRVRKALSVGGGTGEASRDHDQSTTDQTGPYPSEPQTRS